MYKVIKTYEESRTYAYELTDCRQKNYVCVPTVIKKNEGERGTKTQHSHRM